MFANFSEYTIIASFNFLDFDVLILFFSAFFFSVSGLNKTSPKKNITIKIKYTKSSPPFIAITDVRGDSKKSSKTVPHNFIGHFVGKADKCFIIVENNFVEKGVIFDNLPKGCQYFVQQPFFRNR